MKFDTIIIGGGLSGLTAGIESARAGRRPAIVTAGQSALHFWSGSFEFLCEQDSREVIERPLERAARLDPSHPYRRIGIERTERLLGRVQPMLAEAGITVNGSLGRNHYRLTPMGFAKPAWLTLDDYVAFDHPNEISGRQVCVVNIYSYLDFYPRYLEAGLRKLGAAAMSREVNIPQLDVLRKSTTEMRATNISRFLRDDAVDALAREINRVSAGTDMVIMPAILGMFSDEPVKRLRRGVERPIYFVATTPASVPGVRCQLSLKALFNRLGGTYLAGDTVLKGDFEGSRLRRVYTENFGSIPLEADNFMIGSGSFFGHGLVATFDRIFEPVFGLDLNAGKSRTDWYDKDFYAPQPYMAYGVVTDDRFRPSRGGRTVENLYAAGALLSGFNALREGSGAGITLATALAAAEELTR